MKKFLALLLAVVSLMVPMATGVSAATTSYSSFVCGSTSAPYSIANKNEIVGQKMLEKAITVKRGKKATIRVALDAGAARLLNGRMTKHVRFSVWVYDCATKKRVAVSNIKVGQTYTLPVNWWGNRTYSVQVRPYIATSAWKEFGLNTINSYVKTATFCIKY